MPSATENKGEYPGMDDARLLLPWYAAGTLGKEDELRLDELAREDAEFAGEAAAAGREAGEAFALNEALGEPPASVWARIEASVAGEKRASGLAALRARLISASGRFSSFLAGLTVPQWQAVAAIAVTLCLVQAGAIVYLAGGGAPAGPHRTASGKETPAIGLKSRFIVSFADETSIADIGMALEEAGAVIVAGPDSAMRYHIGLRAGGADSQASAYRKLRSAGFVKMILPEN
jgi:hypothetical protein